MLRQFSFRRVAFSFATDLFGTLAMLLLAAYLQTQLGRWPLPMTAFMTRAEIPLSQGWVDVNLEAILPWQVFMLVGAIWPVFLTIFSAYDGRHNETLYAELLNVFLAVCISLLVLAGILYFTYRDTPRAILPIFFVLDVGLLLGVRIVLWAYRLSRTGRDKTRRRTVLIVGAGPVGQDVVQALRRHAWGDLHVVGFVDDDPEKLDKPIGNLSVLGTLQQIPAVLKTYQVQDVVVALPLHAHAQMVEVCRLLLGLGIRVHVIPDLFALSFPNAMLDGFGGIPVIHLGQPGIYGWQRFWKRAFDVAAVLLGLVVISPLLLLIAILIKLDSPGPVLYRQIRVGENGRTFKMFKFRSMYADADPAVHKAYVTRLIEQNVGLVETVDLGSEQESLKMHDDPRVTRMGKFIRKTSLDELPQLLNVLRGEMSLVGPRPPLAYEVEMYKEWHKQRLQAIPGITGWWQVRGRNRVSFDEMVRMDLEYIKNQSIWLDIQILMETPRAVISGRGAG